MTTATTMYADPAAAFEQIYDYDFDVNDDVGPSTTPAGLGVRQNMNLFIKNRPTSPEAEAYADILALSQEVAAGAAPTLLRLALANSAKRRDAMLEVVSDHPELRKAVRGFWRACLKLTQTPTPERTNPYRFAYADTPMYLEAVDEGYQVEEQVEYWDENEDGTIEVGVQDRWTGDRHSRHHSKITINGVEAPELAIANPYAGSLHFGPRKGAPAGSPYTYPKPHGKYEIDEWNPRFEAYLETIGNTVERRLQILAWKAMQGAEIVITAPAETEHARYIAGAIAKTAVKGIPSHIMYDHRGDFASPATIGYNEAAEYNDDLPPLYLEWDWKKFKIAKTGEKLYEVEANTYIRRGTDHLTTRTHGLKPAFVGKHIPAGKRVDPDGNEFDALRWVKYDDEHPPTNWDMRHHITALKDARTEYCLRHPIGVSWPINRLNKKGKIVPDNSARNWAYDHGYRKFDQEQVADVWKYTQYDAFEKRPTKPISVQDLRTRWLYDGRRNPEPDGRMREHDMERADDFNIGENEEWTDATVIANGAGYLTDDDISGMAAAELALIEDQYGAISENEDEQGNLVYTAHTTQREAWYRTVEAAIAAMYKKSEPKGEDKPAGLTTTQAEILAWTKGLHDGSIKPIELVQLATVRGYRDCIRYKPVGDGTWNVYAHAAAAQMMKMTPIKIVSKDYTLTIEQQKKYNDGRSYRPTQHTATPPLAPIGHPRPRRINTDIKGWAILNRWLGCKPAKQNRPKPNYAPIGAVWGNLATDANERAAAQHTKSINAPQDDISDRAIRRRVRAAIKHNK